MSDPPLIVPIDEMLTDENADAVSEAIHGLIRRYRRTLLGDRRHLLEDFRFVDLAHKVVGVGSVGTRAWIVLFLGRDDDDPLLPAGEGGTARPSSPRSSGSPHTRTKGSASSRGSG